jgi:hypothetical protein
MTRHLDLDNPKDARFFLRGVRLEGKMITFVVRGDGFQLNVDQMTDVEAIQYAKNVYFDFLGGIEGKGGYVDLDPMVQEQ